MLHNKFVAYASGLKQLEQDLDGFILAEMKNDPAHDIDHINRVLANTRLIAAQEGGDEEILTAAAKLHDIINYTKEGAQERDSALDSAIRAGEILQTLSSFPHKEKVVEVETCILDHSTINNIKPELLESKILQDADRLDGMGVIGFMRIFGYNDLSNRSFYNPSDPFCQKRTPDRKKYALDYIFSSVIPNYRNLNTAAGYSLGTKRITHLCTQVKMFAEEIGVPLPEEFWADIFSYVDLKIDFNIFNKTLPPRSILMPSSNSLN